MNKHTDWEALKAISNRKNDWFKITNKAGVAEVVLYNEIGWGGVTEDEFANQLDQITAPEILVRINSIGGSVFAGIAIYNAIRQHPAHVTTQVDAMAASIASVIAQAGDRRVMMQHSQMMIHEAAGIAIGSAQDMREYADILERQTDLIADIYTARAGDVGNKATFRKMMSAETWLSDDEAVDIGLADEVVTPSAKSATVTEDKSTADHAENKIDYSSLFTQTIEETLEEIYR